MGLEKEGLGATGSTSGSEAFEYALTCTASGLLAAAETHWCMAPTKPRPDSSHAARLTQGQTEYRRLKPSLYSSRLPHTVCAMTEDYIIPAANVNPVICLCATKYQRRMPLSSTKPTTANLHCPQKASSGRKTRCRIPPAAVSRSPAYRGDQRKRD